MNKNKINLMIEEKRKEKTKVQNKILYYQKNLRNQKILNKINPLNCSFILTAIISLLLPFNFFLTFKSSIITYLIVGTLSYEFQKNILRKIYSHKKLTILKITIFSNTSLKKMVSNLYILIKYFSFYIAIKVSPLL